VSKFELAIFGEQYSAASAAAGSLAKKLTFAENGILKKLSSFWSHMSMKRMFQFLA
jgi:hypothetical protein